MKLLKPLGFN